MDLNKYAEMVSGCDFCEIYESSEEKGIQTVKSTYEISALHMKYKYYVTHVYDPKASSHSCSVSCVLSGNCMKRLKV